MTQKNEFIESSEEEEALSFNPNSPDTSIAENQNVEIGDSEAMIQMVKNHQYQNQLYSTASEFSDEDFPSRTPNKSIPEKQNNTGLHH